MEIKFDLNEAQEAALKEILASPDLHNKERDPNALAKAVFVAQLIRAKQQIIENQLK